MGLFDSKPKANSVFNSIRCDEKDYLIWKWRPLGSELGETGRENSIVWGSSLRVKEGSVAVFVYTGKEGFIQEYIEGPADTIVDTKNLPVISKIVGMAYGGGSPFQAEVYFINLAGMIQTKFAVPYFDVYDPRLTEFSVPIAVRGTIEFNILDYQRFIQIHRLDHFSIDDLRDQIRDLVIENVKSIVLNAPEKYEIPVIQIERKITDIKNEVTDSIGEKLNFDYGINLKGINIAAIEIDKDSEGYDELKSVTKDITAETIKTKSRLNLKDMAANQKIGVFGRAANMITDVKEGAFAKHKEIEKEYQDIIENERAGKFAAASAKIINTIAGLGQKKEEKEVIPPPIPSVSYYIAVGGNPYGPYSILEIKEKIERNEVTEKTLLWKEGMENWLKAEEIDEISSLFRTLVSVPDIPEIPH